MKIAVTYENGAVFQHFGHTEEFKVYDVQDSKVISSEVISSNGSGHGALASLLGSMDIDVLICGGIGGGAVRALEENGIQLVSGASGDADMAVEAFLNGDLTDSGVTCCHHGDGDSCEDHGEDGHCGSHGHDGHCGNHSEDRCGKDADRQSAISGKNVGKTCRTHYRGTFNDGTQFDSSYDRGEPLEFVCGAGMMIKGFDAAVADMNVGDVVDVHLMPSEAYGEKDPNAIFTVPIAQMPGAEGLELGQRVFLQNMQGQPFPVTVAAKDAETITFDANHEMAGKELNFRIELVEVR